MEAITAEFTKQNPNIKINCECIANDFQTILRTRLKSNDGPDIMMLQSYSMIFEYARAGYLINLTNEPFMSNLYPSSLNAVTFDNKFYALPMDMAGIGVIYNKDIFAELGLTIPMTVSELKSICKKISDSGYTPFAVSVADCWPLGHFFSMGHTAMLGSNLDQWLFDMDSGDASFSAEQTNPIFDMLDFIIGNAGPNPLNKNYDDQKADFASGKYAMMVQGLWAYGTGSKQLNPQLNAGFFAFPFTDNPNETKLYADTDSTFAIYSGASQEKIAAAKKFFSFITSPEGTQLWVKQCQLVPTVRGADVSSMDSPYIDLIRYLNQELTMPWAFSVWPTDVFEQSKKSLREYCEGKKSRRNVTDYMTSLWKK
jgi:raffinose/stachyose/melibiose transport system substrate-binding protein